MTRTGLTAALALALAASATTAVALRQTTARASAIRSEQAAKREDFAWGSLLTYYDGEGYAARDELAAVAIIKPGQEIHPPHKHAEEEYLMVVQGEGTWHLNGHESPAKAGDMQYAAPWDVHGIRNTGRTPLRFVVWKFNGKGVTPRPEPK